MKTEPTQNIKITDLQIAELKTKLEKPGLDAKVVDLAKKLFASPDFATEHEYLVKAIENKVKETISWHPFWKILSAVYNFFSGGVSSPHLLLRALPSDQLKELVIQLRKDEKNLEKLKIISEDLSRNFSPLVLEAYKKLCLLNQEGLPQSSLASFYANAITFISDKVTPLHILAEEKSLPNDLKTLTKALIEEGSFINSTDNNGRTPLQLAFLSKNTEIEELLLNKKRQFKI